MERNSEEVGHSATSTTSLPLPPKVTPIAKDFIFNALEKSNKYLARMKNYPDSTVEEINEFEFCKLEAELAGTILQVEAISIKFENKLILFYDKSDVELFEEIQRYREDHPADSRDCALTHFVEWENSDALVDIVYQQNFQSCLTYEYVPGANADVQEKADKRNNVFQPLERFVLLYSSFETNAREAERLQFRFQLRNETIKRHIPAFHDDSDISKTPGFWSKTASTKFVFGYYNTPEETIHKRSVPFVFQALEDYKGGDVETLGRKRVKEHFFSAENKNQLLHSIVSSCYLGIKYHHSKRMTIVELQDDEVFSGYFSLHDDSVHRLSYDMKEAPKLITTKLGLKMWAERFSLSKLPLHAIRSYFGESIGFYFGWLEFYTIWFGYLAILGIISFLYGCFSLVYNRSSAITVFDNEATPVFAFVISIWSLLFLKFWKRRANYLSFIWDMDNYEKVEQVRIQHITSAQRISPVTGKKENYEPVIRTRLRKLIAGTVMLIAFALLSSFIAANIAFFGFLVNVQSVSSTAGMITSSLFAVLQILIVAPLYNQLALILNNFENYMTNTSYLNNLVWKQFMMSFVNSYGLLFFSAIVEPIAKELDPDVRYFGLYQSKCSYNDGFNTCFSDLVISIAIIFGFQQFLNQLFQLVYPYLVVLWERRKQDDLDDQDGVPLYMKQSSLHPITPESFSWEYSTKMIQLGYVLLFSAPFPLAPILGWLNNMMEMRLDVWKYLHFYQRPFVTGSNSIGAWGVILELLIYLSSLTNAIIIGFQSHGLHNLLFSRVPMANDSPYYTLALKFAFVIVFEHMVLIAGLVIDSFIHDASAAVRTAREAENYIERIRLQTLDDDDLPDLP